MMAVSLDHGWKRRIEIPEATSEISNPLSEAQRRTEREATTKPNAEIAGEVAALERARRRAEAVTAVTRPRGSLFRSPSAKSAKELEILWWATGFRVHDPGFVGARAIPGRPRDPRRMKALGPSRAVEVERPSSRLL